MKRKPAAKRKTLSAVEEMDRKEQTRTTGASIATLPQEKAFREVVAMIEAARARAYQAVNTELMDLYWRVGEYISRKIADAGWGKGTVTDLSTYIRQRRPEINPVLAKAIHACIEAEVNRRCPSMEAFLQMIRRVPEDGGL